MDAVRDIRLTKPRRLVDRTEKKRAAEKNWRDVCRAVDARDKFKCRACRKTIRKTLAYVVDRCERHHVVPKSLGGKDSVYNVIQLCLGCHFDRHVNTTLWITGKATGVLTFLRYDTDGELLKTWKSSAP